MEKKNSRVTVYDIAKKLNISPSTVTRALNNQPCISAETRTLVHEAAKSLGYRKNMLAHGLKAKPAKIGLILRNKFPEFQNLIVAGANHACSSLVDLNASLQVAVLDVEDYDDQLLAKFSEFADMGCDGIIFTPPSYGRTDEVQALIAQKNVYASTTFYDTGLNNVNFAVGADNARSGRIAADLFSMSGLKEKDLIVYFTGQIFLEHLQENLRGFTEMNKRYRFDVRVIEHQDDERMARLRTEQILAEEPNIKGIFCSTAVTAPICETLVKANRAQDIVTIGTELLTNCLPYIEDTTLNAVIFQNPYKIGYLSYQTMYNYINGTMPANTAIRINPQIVIRGNMSYYEQRITNVDFDV